MIILEIIRPFSMNKTNRLYSSKTGNPNSPEWVLTTPSGRLGLTRVLDEEAKNTTFFDENSTEQATDACFN